MRPLKAFRIKLVALFGIIVSMLGINSCTYYIETLESSVGNNYLADHNFSRMVVQIQDAVNHVYKGLSLQNCAIITSDLTGPQKQITLDYGVNQMLCYDGVLRSGACYINWEGDPYLSGNVLTVSFSNGFLCNKWYLNGTIKITDLNKNEFNQQEYLMETTGYCGYMESTGENFLWNNVYTRTQIAGDSTLKSDDDIWTVSGTVYAKNEKGRFYNAIIKDSLYFVNACDYGIVKGRVDIAHVDDAQRDFVFYGSSPVCDKWYTFKRGDRVITITKNR